MKVVDATASAAAAVTPVVWNLLGYQFEGASMVAGLLSCLAVRIYMGVTTKGKQGLIVDGAVTVLSLLFTVGWIITQRPEPFYALLTGTGFGALGAGIIKIAHRWVLRFEAFADDRKPAITDDEAIRRLSEQVKDIP